MIRPTNFSHQWCEFFICIAISLVKLLQSSERKFSIYARKILNLLQKNSQSLIFYSMHLVFLLNRVSNSLSRHKGTTFFAYVQKKCKFLGTCTLGFVVYLLLFIFLLLLQFLYCTFNNLFELVCGNTKRFLNIFE